MNETTDFVQVGARGDTGGGFVPREQRGFSATWAQRRISGPDCLSAARFRVARSAP